MKGVRWVACRSARPSTGTHAAASPRMPLRPGADTETPAKLPAEEAALYECVRLEVSDVAAYVADGAFDWQQQQPEGGGTQAVSGAGRWGADVGLGGACLGWQRLAKASPLMPGCLRPFLLSMQGGRLIPLLSRTRMGIALQASHARCLVWAGPGHVMQLLHNGIAHALPAS